MHTKSLNLEIRSIDTATRSVDVVASTEAVDSYGEIVEQVWDLSRFNTNPVVLFAHNSRDLPIGVATRCEVVRGALECTLKFATEDQNPLAERVWRMIQARMLRGVSVGFQPGSVRTERRNGVDTVILSDNTLHEVSVVPIPANPEALARAAGHGRADEGPPDLAELMDQTDASEIDAWFRAEPSQPRPRPPAESADDDTPDLGDLLGGAA